MRCLEKGIHIYVSGEWNGGGDVLAEFKRLKSALSKLVKQRVQRRFRNLTMTELFDRLNTNTVQHGDEEDKGIIEPEQLHQYVCIWQPTHFTLTSIGLRHRRS